MKKCAYEHHAAQKLSSSDNMRRMGGGKQKGQKMAPPQVSAEVLKKMKKTAEDYLGEPVTEALSPYLLTLTMLSVRQPKTPAVSQVWM